MSLKFKIISVNLPQKLNQEEHKEQQQLQKRQQNIYENHQLHYNEQQYKEFNENQVEQNKEENQEEQNNNNIPQLLQRIQRNKFQYKKNRHKNFLTNFWIITIILMLTPKFHVISGEIIFRVDPLALLSATLRTYQRAVCDTDQVILTCPRGTSISIEVAQYSKQDDGISIDELCPLNEGLSSPKQVIIGSTNSNSNDSIKFNSNLNNSSISGGSGNSGSSSSSSSNSNTNTINNNNNIKNSNNISLNNNNNNINITNSTNTNNNNDLNSIGNNDSNNFGGISSTEIVMPENCMWPNAFQYSLLQTVVEACQKKKHCKFNATPGTYGVGASGRGEAGSSSFHHRMPDPCPRVRKFVEIAYKCRPYEFRSKVACENDIVQLECNPYSRIAVYSASFGRTEYESIQCPQPQGVREETCLASYATETVMQICHGRRRCNLAADANTFGSPCHRNSRMYLKVVYTCVPKQVLKERYESVSEIDEPEDFEGDANDLYDDDPYYKESEAIPKLQSNLTRNVNSNNITVGLSTNSTNSNTTSTIEPTLSSSNPIMTHTMGMNFESNNEKFYIILLLVGTGCILFCVVIIATRLIMLRKRAESATQDQHSTNSSKGETTIPNGFNDSISEIDADIDLTVQMSVPSVSKSENLINYSQTSSLYGSLGPSNVSHTSSTMLLQAAPNPLLCTRQSPDIIGVTNSYMTAQPPGSVASSFTHVSSGIGTIVPITSLAQYTTATGSTFHTGTKPPPTAGYIMDSDGVLRRPAASVINSQQQQQQQKPLPSIVIGSGGTINSVIGHQLSTSSSSSISPQPISISTSINQPHHKSTVVVVSPPLSAQTSIELPFHYDGTPPRTLSTGVAQNPQFFYG
ncbi:probable serine/threonine-protein kinase pats1 [Condylostylus longicornis]|uniref:probable serine/threonine-protein kinase pats1 n=1 Tax=Condylostylus longicornis TaxID=2530218 RepID=UPI00244DCC2A|nr:probable serine/threonine-protein kinase pats1 [Condylostylus longicornis]